QLRLMLQSLLADRFRFVFHRETKDLAVYAINQAKSGARLRTSQGGPENSLSFQSAQWAFRNYSIPALAKFLSSLPSLDRPVSDATGLQGNFDFEINIDSQGNDPASIKRAMLDWPSMFADLEQQLGLKMEARKA